MNVLTSTIYTIGIIKIKIPFIKQKLSTVIKQDSSESVGAKCGAEINFVGSLIIKKTINFQIISISD